MISAFLSPLTYFSMTDGILHEEMKAFKERYITTLVTVAPVRQVDDFESQHYADWIRVKQELPVMPEEFTNLITERFDSYLGGAVKERVS
tara:strand:+ start:8734 stop:9003 length:270 start_codon:yes stop_codon:yes gene_type:complete